MQIVVRYYLKYYFRFLIKTGNVLSMFLDNGQHRSIYHCTKPFYKISHIHGELTWNNINIPKASHLCSRSSQLRAADCQTYKKGAKSLQIHYSITLRRQWCAIYSLSYAQLNVVPSALHMIIRKVLYTRRLVKSGTTKALIFAETSLLKGADSKLWGKYNYNGPLQLWMSLCTQSIQNIDCQLLMSENSFTLHPAAYKIALL